MRSEGLIRTDPSSSCFRGGEPRLRLPLTLLHRLSPSFPTSEPSTTSKSLRTRPVRRPVEVARWLRARAATFTCRTRSIHSPLLVQDGFLVSDSTGELTLPRVWSTAHIRHTRHRQKWNTPPATSVAFSASCASPTRKRSGMRLTSTSRTTLNSSVRFFRVRSRVLDRQVSSGAVVALTRS